jgi:hypothetical protein
MFLGFSQLPPDDRSLPWTWIVPLLSAVGLMMLKGLMSAVRYFARLAWEDAMADLEQRVAVLEHENERLRHRGGRYESGS